MHLYLGNAVAHYNPNGSVRGREADYVYVTTTGEFESISELFSARTGEPPASLRTNIYGVCYDSYSISFYWDDPEPNRPRNSEIWRVLCHIPAETAISDILGLTGAIENDENLDEAKLREILEEFREIYDANLRMQEAIDSSESKIRELEEENNTLDQEALRLLDEFGQEMARVCRLRGTVGAVGIPEECDYFLDTYPEEELPGGPPTADIDPTRRLQTRRSILQIIGEELISAGLDWVSLWFISLDDEPEVERLLNEAQEAYLKAENNRAYIDSQTKYITPLMTEMQRNANNAYYKYTSEVLNRSQGGTSDYAGDLSPTHNPVSIMYYLVTEMEKRIQESE